MRWCPHTFHSCGQWYSPDSSDTPLSPCHSLQHDRYIGRAGSWESPNTQGDIGHTAEHICPGNSGTGPWQHRRKHSQILVDCSHKLQTRQTKNSLNRQICLHMWTALIHSNHSHQAQSRALPLEVRESPKTVPEFFTKSVIHLRLHPLGPKPKVPGAHLLHVLPTTLGRHWHWPPLGSHTELREPWGSHSQAAGKRAMVRLMTGAECHTCLPLNTPQPLSYSSSENSSLKTSSCANWEGTSQLPWQINTGFVGRKSLRAQISDNIKLLTTGSWSNLS